LDKTADNREETRREDEEKRREEKSWERAGPPK
jgi:hypothetical protein